MKKPKLCKRLPCDATPKQRELAHRTKMATKKNRPRLTQNPPIFANLSHNHPDYGLTPQAHAAKKAKRI